MPLWETSDGKKFEVAHDDPYYVVCGLRELSMERTQTVADWLLNSRTLIKEQTGHDVRYSSFEEYVEDITKLGLIRRIK